MLPKQHRLSRADEFRRVVRNGRRRVGATVMTHVVPTTAGEPARFGFIVSKAVGGAVTRNLVKRRLRAIVAADILAGFAGAEVVVRAMPGSADATYEQLRSDLAAQLGRASSERVTA